MLLKHRLHAGGIHLGISLVVALLVGVVAFMIWYPSPYASLAGGLSLFLLLVSVDVILGPALTTVVASPTKPRKELIRDVSLIALIQLAAFAYGLHTLALARPVYLSFEVDRLRVVTAADIEPDSLAEAPLNLRSLPCCGPKLIAAVKPTDPKEQFESIQLGLSGIDLSMVPRNWRDYASQSDAVWRKARPLSVLSTKYPASTAEINAAVAKSGVSESELRFLPVVSRQAMWVGLIAAPDSRVVGYLPLDGFF